MNRPDERELAAALDRLGLYETDVRDARLEGYTIVLITQAGEKHRLPTLAHAARVKAEEESQL